MLSWSVTLEVRKRHSSTSLQRLELTRWPVWIGRDASCGLVLDGMTVSRRHASIDLRERGLIVSDFSHNGTVVNALPLKKASRVLPLTPCVLEIDEYAIALEPRAVTEAAAQSVPVATACACVWPQSSAPAPLRRRIHGLLLERLELAKIDARQLQAEVLEPTVRAALRRILSELAPELPAGIDHELLIRELTDEALGLGPLEQLLRDGDVSEIMVVDPLTIYAERRGQLELTGLRFTDDDAVQGAIERIISPLGRRIDQATPLVDARLKDGSRVNAVIPPLAVRGPCITIRKFAKEPFTTADLIAFGSLDERIARFLEHCVQARKNLVISGGTGSGKTTLLNVLSAAVPERERIVTIEDAAELQLRQPHVVALEARPPNLEGRGEYTIRDLLKNALRMRPDRIVVGECRGGEAIDMLQAMNTGHEGSMTTTHANSPREAIARLETLCLMAGLDLPVRAVRAQIAASIHVIVQQARFSDGSRRITHVTEVAGAHPDGEIELHDIFEFVPAAAGPDGVRGEFRATGYLPSFLDEFITEGLTGAGVHL